MWLGGQWRKPGPTYPATVAAWPPAWLFRIRIFCSRGSLTPVAAPNDFLARGPAAEKRFRIRCLSDVALGPSVETGAGVPGQREVDSLPDEGLPLFDGPQGGRNRGEIVAV